MKQKIITALTKDVGLKILAFIFAFLLWLVVVNIDDPTQTRTFTSVVTVTNGDVLKSAGKLYEIKDGINTVSFRVTASKIICMLCLRMRRLRGLLLAHKLQVL